MRRSEAALLLLLLSSGGSKQVVECARLTGARLTALLLARCLRGGKHTTHRLVRSADILVSRGLEQIVHLLLVAGVRRRIIVIKLARGLDARVLARVLVDRIENHGALRSHLGHPDELLLARGRVFADR